MIIRSILLFFLCYAPFAEPLKARFVYYKECPLTCTSVRPGLVPELLYLAFQEQKRFNFKSNIQTAERFKALLKEGKVEIHLSFGNDNNRFLYSRKPLTKIRYCVYGKTGTKFTEEQLRRNRFAYKNYDFINRKTSPMLTRLYHSNSLPITRHEINIDNQVLLSKIRNNKVDWVLLSNAYMSYMVKDQNRNLNEVDCIYDFDIYLAFDKNIAYSWELKKYLDDFFAKDLKKEDYLELIKYYQLEATLF